MALINCRECGREISDAAPMCPGCGCPKLLAEEPPAQEPARKTAATLRGPQPTKQLSTPPAFWISLGLLAAVVCIVLLNQNRIAKETAWGSSGYRSRSHSSSLLDSTPPVPKSLPSRSLGSTIKPKKTESPAASVTLINETVDDSPIKTQVAQYLLVAKGTSAGALRALLARQHAEVSRRSGFKYRAHPDAIYIYAYDTKEKAETERYHSLWVAMSQMSPGQTTPEVTVAKVTNARAGTQKDKASSKINGFSMAKRMQIYKDLSKGERRAASEAQLKYPTDVFKQIDLEEALFQKYRSAVRTKHGIDEPFCIKVITEGVMNRWPD